MISATERLPPACPPPEEHIASFNDGDEYIIVDEYVDDGISGTTDDERDDFQRMLGDIKKGRINCVIVKDLCPFFPKLQRSGLLFR